MKHYYAGFICCNLQIKEVGNSIIKANQITLILKYCIVEMLFKVVTGIVNMKTQNKHRLNIRKFFPSMFCEGFPFYKRSVLPS